jgi:phenylacetate-CoA ligase
MVAQYEYWEKDRHEHWQLEQLKTLLHRAVRHVPYYRRRFRGLGAHPEDFVSLHDFAQLPFLTKDEILNNGPRAFCDERIPSYLQARSDTSGSMGRPCPLLHFRPFSSVWERTFMHQQWKRIGYQVGDRIGVLRRAVILDTDKPYQFHKNENRLILSTGALKQSCIQDYIDILNDFQVKFLHVYPSSVMLFIEYLQNASDSMIFPHLKGLLVGSEIFLPYQKALCATIFDVPCHHWYGHTEMALMGGWCEDTEKFHFFPQYGYLELINKTGERIDRPEEIGELLSPT